MSLMNDEAALLGVWRWWMGREVRWGGAGSGVGWGGEGRGAARSVCVGEGILIRFYEDPTRPREGEGCPSLAPPLSSNAALTSDSSSLPRYRITPCETRSLIEYYTAGW